MREVGAFEAKNTLGNRLDLVEHGEEVVITRHGKPVARMIKETGRRDRSAEIEAAQNIRALAKDIALGGFDWAEWKAYRDEGRR
jgi:antitoxin (DNA-binding transcriptional repressor) of toxin-antitoxin stability system